MTVRKVVAGSVLAAGLGVAGMLGASPAQALGLSVDDGNGGGFTVGSGATASATPGKRNQAIAVSVFAPATATVGGNAKGSTAVAIGVSSPTGASSTIEGDADGGGAYTLDGHTTIKGNAKGTQVFNVYTKEIKAKGDAGATTTVAVCGTELTAQAAHVTVSSGCN
jgi:hypothetical protein